jgi:hypothetical protein
MSDAPRYYESDSPCRRCSGVLRYRAPLALKGKCASCVACEEAETRTKKWIAETPDTLTPDDEDPTEEMLIEGWDG